MVRITAAGRRALSDSLDALRRLTQGLVLGGGA
jgi:hypothetical protein